ncbi:hypothetical protein Hdeb2414_s0009g00321431 [Helianthus debilis subsp. tardiflorus]
MATALSAGFDEIKPPDITKSGVEEPSLTAHWISKTILTQFKSCKRVMLDLKMKWLLAV